MSEPLEVRAQPNRRIERSPIVVAGGVNLDLVVRLPRLPGPGETVHGRDLVQVPGGKGGNQATAVARLGGDVRLIALVGADSAGNTLRQSLSEDGIGTQWVTTLPEVPSGVALIAVADDGSNTIVVAPGANARASKETVSAAREAFREARVVVGQLEWPFDAVQELLARAPATALRVLNAAPGERRALDLLAGLEWLVVNETEAALLSGCTVDSEASAREAGRILLHHGVRQVIVTLGQRGAILCTPDNCWHQPAARVEVVDTTAAGDAFVGGLAVALAEQKPLAVALQFAAAAGGLACTVLGARPSLPHREAVEQLIALMPAATSW